MIFDKIIRVAVLTLTCVLLSSCYLVPGSFTAALDIRRDGSFTYRYVGDIAYASPDAPPRTEWQDSMARCFDDKTAKPRTCSKAETDQQRISHESIQNRDSKESAELAELIGFNPLDADANRKIAAEMMQYDGWKKVTYKGEGVFAVEYETSGTLERDFLFPTSPTAQVIIPFLSIRRSGGVVTIGAPGFTGGVMRKIMLGNMGISDNMGMPGKDLQYFDRINGTFTLTTDAEISYSTGKPKVEDGRRTKAIWQIVKGEADYSADTKVEAQILLP